MQLNDKHKDVFQDEENSRESHNVPLTESENTQESVCFFIHVPGSSQISSQTSIVAGHDSDPTLYPKVVSESNFRLHERLKKINTRTRKITFQGDHDGNGDGDAGVVSLVNFLPKLIYLDLRFCDKVEFDAILAECDRITDCGGVEFDAIMLLGGIGFGKCGPNVTDLAGEAIASSESLKRLTLSGSVYQYSTKDDAIVKYWDITTESKFYDLLGHKDYVRCGDDSPVSDDMFVSGSYDHTVKV
uniref:U3 small nucleolar RNA-associated protein n=1 Tax=Solanum tuberosum TaxID=4113 RepID=M0ZVA5_SOLTU